MRPSAAIGFRTSFGTSQDVVARSRCIHGRSSNGESGPLAGASSWREPDSNRGHHDFQGVAAGAAPSRNACKSTTLASRCAAAMLAVWRSFARIWDFVRRAESQTSVGALRRANGRWRHSRPRSAEPRSEAVSPATRRRTPGGPAGRRARRIDAHLRPHRRVSDRRRDPPARGRLRAAHAAGSGVCRRSVAVSRMLSCLQCNQPDAFRPWAKARARPLGAISGISA